MFNSLHTIGKMKLRAGQDITVPFMCCNPGPGWRGAIPSNVPMVDWALHGCGKSNKGIVIGSLYVQLSAVCTFYLLAGKACDDYKKHFWCAYSWRGWGVP